MKYVIINLDTNEKVAVGEIKATDSIYVIYDHMDALVKEDQFLRKDRLEAHTEESEFYTD